MGVDFGPHLVAQSCPLRLDRVDRGRVLSLWVHASGSRPAYRGRGGRHRDPAMAVVGRGSPEP